MKAPKLDLVKAKELLAERDRLDAFLEEIAERRRRLEARHAELIGEREPLASAAKSALDVVQRREATADEILAGARTGSEPIGSKTVAELGRHNTQGEIELANLERDIGTLAAELADTDGTIAAVTGERQAVHRAFLEALRDALIEYHGAIGDFMVSEIMVPLIALGNEMAAAEAPVGIVRGMIESAGIKHWRNAKMELLWPREDIGRAANRDPDADSALSELIVRVRGAR